MADIIQNQVSLSVIIDYARILFNPFLLCNIITIFTSYRDTKPNQTVPEDTVKDSNIDGNNIFTTRSLHKNSSPLQTLNSRAQQYREANLDFRNPSDNQMGLVNKKDPYILNPKTFERKYEQVAETLRQAANKSAVSLSELQPSMDDENTKINGATSLKVFYRFNHLRFYSKTF